MSVVTVDAKLLYLLLALIVDPFNVLNLHS